MGQARLLAFICQLLGWPALMSVPAPSNMIGATSDLLPLS